MVHQTVKATHDGEFGCVWRVPQNEVWNPPADACDVRFQIEARGPWQIISKVRGLAMSPDGTIHGVRSLLRPRESGYAMEGAVSIGGKRIRAFTSSALFFAQNGKLCNVAILYVCDRQALFAPN